MAKGDLPGCSLHAWRTGWCDEMSLARTSVPTLRTGHFLSLGKFFLPFTQAHLVSCVCLLQQWILWPACKFQPRWSPHPHGRVFHSCRAPPTLVVICFVCTGEHPDSFDVLLCVAAPDATAHIAPQSSGAFSKNWEGKFCIPHTEFHPYCNFRASLCFT